jgi:hypothetical protein
MQQIRLAQGVLKNDPRCLQILCQIEYVHCNYTSRPPSQTHICMPACTHICGSVHKHLCISALARPTSRPEISVLTWPHTRPLGAWLLPYTCSCPNAGVCLPVLAQPFRHSDMVWCPGTSRCAWQCGIWASGTRRGALGHYIINTRPPSPPLPDNMNATHLWRLFRSMCVSPLYL